MVSEQKLGSKHFDITMVKQDERSCRMSVELNTRTGGCSPLFASRYRAINFIGASMNLNSFQLDPHSNPTIAFLWVRVQFSERAENNNYIGFN